MNLPALMRQHDALPGPKTPIRAQPELRLDALVIIAFGDFGPQRQRSTSGMNMPISDNLCHQRRDLGASRPLCSAKRRKQSVEADRRRVSVHKAKRHDHPEHDEHDRDVAPRSRAAADAGHGFAGQSPLCLLDAAGREHVGLVQTGGGELDARRQPPSHSGNGLFDAQGQLRHRRPETQRRAKVSPHGVTQAGGGPEQQPEADGPRQPKQIVQGDEGGRQTEGPGHDCRYPLGDKQGPAATPQLAQFRNHLLHRPAPAPN